MLCHAIKLLLILQFALVAIVPCRCIAQQYAASETVSPVVCCVGGSCRLDQDDRPGAAAGPDHRLCPQPKRRTTCPGRLLPDLAPPPAAPSDDLPSLLNRPQVCGDIEIEPQDHLDMQSTSARTARSPARPADQSLLRQHCALII